jgi:hypothetical protein
MSKAFSQKGYTTIIVSARHYIQLFSQGEDDSWCGNTKSSMKRGVVGQTEVEVIRDWFVKIFMPLEKTADIVVTDFKFEQLSHLRAQYQNQQQKSRSGGGRPPADPGVDSDSSACNGDNGLNGSNSPFTVLKKADVELMVGGKAKVYSVVIKVLPTDDVERHTSRRKFSDLLKFSKEVQVYCQALRCMVSYDEKRYSSACIEPPVPKCYLGQLDAQNDVLVLEDLGQTGYRKFNGGCTTATRYLADIDHCRVVLRRLAHFHAFSTVIQRDAEETLLDLFPFAVDASVFKESFQARVAVVKAELVRYLVCNKGMVSDADEAAEKVERHLQDLFWRLVELRAQPHNMRMCVLAHGALDLRNIVFLYDETSGRPISAKFLDFSTLTVSSPIIDISYFLHSSVLPEVASHHHSTLLTTYHRAHLEAIKSFGMHGFEMELDDLLTEYHAKQDYGAMMACLLKPALYVLQCIGSVDQSPEAATNGDKVANGDKTTNGDKASNGDKATNGKHINGSASNNDIEAVTNDDDDDLELDNGSRPWSRSEHESTLKIDKNLVPVDLRLHGYLSNLAKACPCPCAVGSRDLTIAELSADSLEELHIEARQQVEDHKLKAFDCNGSTKSTLKKLFKGLITPTQGGNNTNISSSGNKTNNNSSSTAEAGSEASKKASSKEAPAALAAGESGKSK